MRTAARVDDNQADLVKVLRSAGCSVQSLASVGHGIPDLMVYSPHIDALVLMEVKDGSKPPSARQLTTDQAKWHRQWRGPVHVVTTIMEALAAVGIEIAGGA